MWDQGGTRREFLTWLTAMGSGVVLGRIGRVDAVWAAPIPKATGDTPPDEVTPTEDLMREHGVLNRLLLIYEACNKQLVGGGTYDPAPLRDAVAIVRRFIEDYHERLEEDHIFPRFEKAGRLTDLVRVLRQQHQAGRRVSADMAELTSRIVPDTLGKQQLSQAIGAFVRMYRPHEAREDTVLFPALRSLMSPAALDEMGDAFEDREHQLFGQAGFKGIVEQVADIERRLGIYDLAQFTP